MSIFVLIHGGCHGGWCWNKVAALLRAEGHIVETPDLPGHGEDKTPLTDITLQAYVDTICQILDQAPEPVILVGHSMGGMSISQAAEYRPDKIRMLVYLTAWLLKDGQVRFERPPSEWLDDPVFALTEDRLAFYVRDEMVADYFYGQCTEADVAWAKALLVPEPIAPISPLKLSNENYGRIPRVYIECLKDHCITPASQKAMYMALPCAQVITMDTDHSPFLSAPEELARHLLSFC